MAFTPSVSWNTAFNATPAGNDDPRAGDDRIRELKTALYERLSRELYFGLVGGSSAGQEGNLRQGAGRVYHRSSAPTLKPDGNTLDADDVGRMYCQSNTTPLQVYTSNLAWVPVGTVPIGTILPWHKSLTGTPALPTGWVQCDGQTLSDAASPYNGRVIPDLNGTGLFLRGSSTSGTLQSQGTRLPSSQFTISLVGIVGGGTGKWGIGEGGTGGALASPTAWGGGDAETRPVNMSVVWIMRVK
jgi:hypothetical protein